MARKTKPLTDTEIKAAKSKDADYLLYDGDGLTLLVKHSGSKLWQFRYYRPFTKQRTKQSFGSYPSVTLSDARKLRAESRALLAKDIDPQEHQEEKVRNSLEAKTKYLHDGCRTLVRCEKEQRDRRLCERYLALS
ncbi:Prophage CP4-57 integrase [Cedecea neteri]|uniref:Prophage CP4-57 integrase n=1 Tax=Cedecea neteri TaxID=158822 RepID=A0A2X3IY16_9ENTR|nr:Prophage CP4-57 integrase [Cedecea neteri]